MKADKLKRRKEEYRVDTAARRMAILNDLKTAGKPTSASFLAKRYQVSRQIIVGDIALLRAAGEKIFATPRGYMFDTDHDGGTVTKTIACCHQGEKALLDELYTVVDLGGEVLDVIVDHAVYGQLIGRLQIRSRYDVDVFIDKIRKNRAAPLSTLTEGIHLHTLSCPSEEVFERIRTALLEKGVLLSDEA